MAGQVMSLWTKRSFNFNGLTAGSTEAVVAVKTLDVSAYREATITVRAHTRDIVNASSKIEIIAYMTAPTGEDPAVDFVSGTALTTATIASGSTSVLSTANLSTFGGYLRIVVLGTRVTSGNCSADLRGCPTEKWPERDRSGHPQIGQHQATSVRTSLRHMIMDIA